MIQPNTTVIDPRDESFWSGIRAQYRVSEDFINLENGFFSIPALPVQDALEAHNRLVNTEGAFFMRNKYPQRLEQVTAALTGFAGAAAGEVLIVRNPTEAMNILLQGYPFRPGDEVVIGNQDYDSVDAALAMLEQRGRLKSVRVALPFDTTSDEQIVALYEQAISPKTRVIVVTHLLHRTGQILPAAKIAAMAKARGIDVMVDAAHSFAHLDYRLPDLGSDFVAGHLHKWFGAPLGVGLLYIRKERVADIAPLFGDVAFPTTDIRKLGHFGTTPPGPILAVEDALAFHNSIGSRNKEARLRYLQRYWTDQVRELGHIQLLLPAAPERSCAIAAFRVRGMEAQAVRDYLMNEHRVFTAVPKLYNGEAVRVTPHLYTTTAHLDTLVGALKRLG